MAPPAKSFDPRELARLKGLRLRARAIVEGYLAGVHRNPRAGFSIEFAEHREYVPGDDLRYLDWKVYGRSDKYYLKRFEDETNLICYLAVDNSESMNYRSPTAAMSKREYAHCLAAAMAWLVLRQRDAVGLAVWDDAVQSYLPPSDRSASWEHLLDALDAAEQDRASDIGASLEALSVRLNRRGVVLLISDFLAPLKSIQLGLQRLAARRHDVVVFQLLDPAELDFPFDGPTRFVGLEQLGQRRVDAPALRRTYLEEVERFSRALKSCCRELSMAIQTVRTDQPFDEVLRRFLAGRQRQG